MIYVRKVSFSNAPVGDFVVEEPMYVNDAEVLVASVWRDINYFQEKHGLRLLQVIQLEQGAYKPPIQVGIFEGAEWRDF